MLVKGFYALLGFIDYIVYSLASTVMSVILAIADKQIFEVDKIEEIANRVYVVIGVLILFKLVISAIQFMANPDTFDDKEKGLGGLLKKTVITIILVTVAPAVFNFMIAIQNTIVAEIPNIVFGPVQKSNEENKRTTDDVIFTILKSFVKPNKEKGGKEIGDKSGIYDLESFKNHVADGCEKGGILGAGDASNCQYDYMIIVSTLAGGFLCYVLLSMTLDVAVRTFKFGIIRILAPIPISSYVFSKDKLNKFIKTTMTVYCDLFIRLAIVYFIIFAAEVIVSSKIVEEIGGDDWFTDVLANVAIFGGLFMFAKSAPKFITELLGLPDVGAGDMKDMFKPAWQRYGGAAGALANPVSNAIANVHRARQNGEKGVANMLRRAAGGAARGVVDAFAGAAAGDDWQKMRARHDKALQKSSERSLAHANRTKNKSQSAQKKNALTSMLAGLKERRETMVTDADRMQAEQNYENRVNNLKTLADRIHNEKDPTKRNALIDEYRRETSALNNRNEFIQKEAIRVAAQRQVGEKVTAIDQKIGDYQTQISEIDKKIAAGGIDSLEQAALLAERADIEDKITSANQEKENLTQDSAIKDAESKIESAERHTKTLNAQLGTAHENLENARNVISAAEKVVTNGKAEIAAIDEKMKSLDPTSSEYKDLIVQKDAAQKRISIAQDKITAAHEREQTYTADITRITEAKAKVAESAKAAEKVRIEAINKREAQIEAFVDEYAKINGQISDGEKEIEKINDAERTARVAIMKSRFSDVNSYLGGVTPSGKGYLDLSSFLGSSRSGIYTGEAMTKMRQNADIVIDETTGRPVEYNIKFTSKPNVKMSYADMADIKRKADNGTITADELERYGFANIAMVQSAFEDIEKQAAADYINANLTRIYGSYFKDSKGVERRVKLKDGSAANSAVVEWYDDFAADLYKNGASKNDLDKLFDEFQENPGEFIKKASEYKDRYASVGKKIVDSAKPNDGKK